MRPEYRIVPALQATADLEAIFASVEKNSPQNAVRVLERIHDAIDSLKMFPNRTVVRGSRGKGKSPVRSLPVQSWIVFFRVLEDEKVVRILHIRHGARRRPRSFE